MLLREMAVGNYTRNVNRGEENQVGKRTIYAERAQKFAVGIEYSEIMPQNTQFKNAT